MCGSRWHDAMETRRSMRGDEVTQEEVVVWRHLTSMAEWPDKVEASMYALKTDLWKMAATTHECV